MGAIFQVPEARLTLQRLCFADLEQQGSAMGVATFKVRSKALHGAIDQLA